MNEQNKQEEEMIIRVDDCEPECALWGIFNHIYEKHGFMGVLNHIELLLRYGEVSCIDEDTEVYCITTKGWNDDEYVLDELNHVLSLFHSIHYIGDSVGGDYYYTKDKDNFVKKLVPKVKEEEEE